MPPAYNTNVPVNQGFQQNWHNQYPNHNQNQNMMKPAEKKVFRYYKLDQQVKWEELFTFTTFYNPAKHKEYVQKITSYKTMQMNKANNANKNNNNMHNRNNYPPPKGPIRQSYMAAPGQYGNINKMSLNPGTFPMN